MTRRLAVPFFGLLLLGLVWAQPPGPAPSPDVPVPSPTNNAESAGKTLRVIGEGAVQPGLEPTLALEQARQAALLSAYRQLSEAGAESLGILSDDPLKRAGYQYFRISDDHPNDALIDWCLRSKVEGEERVGGTLKLWLMSPPLADLQQDFPHLVRSLERDVDGDGKLETIGAGYDGRVYVLRKMGNVFQVMASTPSENTLSVRTYVPPGGRTASWDHVRLTRLDSVEGLEVLPNRPDSPRLRVLIKLSSWEEVGGAFLGQAAEQRELLVRLNADPVPTMELQAPTDFVHTTRASEQLLGVLRAPAGLAKARVRFNGREFWQTPDGLNSRKLNMDVMVPLLPGDNRAQVFMLDQNHITSTREVVMHRDAPVAGVDARNRRALMIGVGRYESPSFPALASAEGDLAAVRAALARGGFSQANVRSLLGAQATRANIMEALRDFSVREGGEGGRSLLVVYFNGLTTPGSASEGKSLMPYDTKAPDVNAISAQDLLEVVGSYGDQEVLVILDGARSGPAASPEVRWLDCHDFLETMAGRGWAVLSTCDPEPAERESSGAMRLSQALVEALQGAGDTDNDGAVELDELYRALFTAMQRQGSIVKRRPAYPLRRGQILGRLPIVKLH